MTEDSRPSGLRLDSGRSIARPRLRRAGGKIAAGEKNARYLDGRGEWEWTMKFDTMLVEARRKEMQPSGYWHDELFTDHLDLCVAQVPDKTAIIDFNSMEQRGRRLNYRELGALVDRLAVGLAELGIEKNDIVSCQLPNWWQFGALAFACWRIGAVFNPMMPIFREREIKFMLGFAESKILIVPRQYRGFDYPGMVRGVRLELPHLQRLLVVGGSGEECFERVLLDTPWETKRDPKRLFAERRQAPDEVIQLLYTSGTTGEPKGVMHTSNTLLSNIYPFCERLDLSGNDLVLMSSPLAHQSGFLYGLLMPVILRAAVVLQDIWDGKRAAHLIDKEGVTFTFASTPFLSDLTDAVAQGAGTVASLRYFVAAGAPIPRVLVERATKTLGAAVISAWGMTENGAVTTTKPADPDEKAFFTDGRALPGMEVKVVGADGELMSPGQEGLLKVRGCSNFVGYLRRPQLYNHDTEGWFDTGDLARADADGYIRITGRAKDIIIRGGENIPVIEIEGLLFRHPAVQSVAIVGIPDARLGERACSFVVAKPGRHFSFEEMIRFLVEQKVARQYMPERLEVVDELPVTPSGKVQKFKLREIAKALVRPA